MIYGIILAAGIGKRFNDDLPKQYHYLDEKPVIIHTIEKFINYKDNITIVLVVNKDFVDYTEKLIAKFIPDNKITIVKGGKTRNESLISACEYLFENNDVNDDDIIITHDGDRPFINNRIIEENIDALNVYDGVSTAIDTNNSILEVNEDKVVNVPIRKNMKIVQTPQTFRLKQYMDNYNTLSKTEKDGLVEATKSYVLRNKNVGIVNGEPFNIKITTQYDLEVAKVIIEKKIIK